MTPLQDLRRSDAASYGGKAACLGELIAAGFDVPPGVALPTAEYRRFLRLRGLEQLAAAKEAESRDASPARLVEISEEIAAAFSRCDPPPAVAVEQICHTDGGLYAVRSSATLEDSPHATCAGQYVSVLDVPADGVSRAIARVYASLFGARAAMYRRRMELVGDVAMAVVVQPMIAGDAAGVVFTHAPRRPGSLLIECAPLRGDAVVSGTVAPARYYVDRSTLEIDAAAARYPFEAGLIRAVARTALAVEARLSQPQDIEFAIAGETVVLLQARPVAGGRAA